jgi:hypothetical protein
MDENGTVGLVLSLAIGMAILAACGVVSFTLLLVGILAL